MSKEEKFKKTLQHLLDESHFSFQESDWDAAKKVIDDNRRKRRFGAIWFVLAGIVVIGGLVGLLPSKSFERKISAQPEKPNAAAIASIEAQVKPSLSKHPSPSKSPSQTNQKTFTPPLQKSNTPVARETHSPAMVESTPASEQNQILAQNKNHASENQESEVVVAIPVIANTASDEEEKTVTTTSEEKEILLPTKKEADTALQSEKIDAFVNETETPTTDPNPAVFAEPVLAQKSIDSLEKTSAEPLPSALPELKKKMQWSAEAGFTALYGWKSSQGTEGRGFNPVLGVNYHNSMSEKLDYSLGFNFTSIAHLHAFNDTSKITKYKFGEESQVTVISPRSFYYIHFPLRINWSFSEQQSIGANFNLGYLLNVRSQVGTYQESLTTGEKTQSQELGYTEGVSPFNFQFGFFYRRKIFNNLYLQPEIFFGLVDLKDNVFFKSEGKERSSGIQITLLYSLKNK